MSRRCSVWNLFFLFLLFGSTRVFAHDAGLIDVRIEQTAPHRFTMNIQGNYGDLSFLLPEWPVHCHYDNPATTFQMPRRFLVNCDEAFSRSDQLSFAWPVAGLYLQWDADKQSHIRVLQPSKEGFASIALHELTGTQFSSVSTLMTFTGIGFEHLMGGYDHLLFVFTLFLILTSTRQLLWAASAFTLGHSITLACASLGLFAPEPKPIETCIALSIVFMAQEACVSKHHSTATKRYPMLFCLVIGLLHGLGFAGALQDIGMPEHQLPAALVGFNVGIEIGQVMTLLVLLTLQNAYRAFRSTFRFTTMRWDQRWLTYPIGIVSSYWAISRFFS